MASLHSSSKKKGDGRLRWASRMIWLVVLAVAVLAGTMYRQQVAEAASRFFTPPDEDPIPVMRLKKRDFQLEVPAFGEVTGLETTPVPTPSTRSGALKIAWLIDEGTLVEKGDLLIRFDSTEAQLNLEKQQNVLDSTGKRIDLQRGRQETDQKVLGIDKSDAQMEYDYAMNVMPEDESIFSKWDIIEAQINAGLAKEKIQFISQKLRVNKRSARADLQMITIDENKAQTEIDIARQTLNALELRAPIGGLVLYKRDYRRSEPQVGDEAWRGQALVEIVDLSLLQGEIHILEVDAGQVVKGQPVAVRLDALPEKVYHGVIKSVSALAQPLERQSPLKYFDCDVIISDVGADMRKIKPGMALKAKVILDQYQSIFLVPNSAIAVKDGKSLVYLQEGEQYVPREVQLGSRNHGQAVVLDGLNQNELLAMRNPFETRKAHLPDFSKAGAQQGGRRIMIRGGRGDIRVIVH